MRIYRVSSKGDELVAECATVEEAEQILRSYLAQRCFLATETEVIDLDTVRTARPESVWIFWPMRGGEP